MELKSLPELEFAASDPDTIETAIITVYEKLVGRTLAQADPIRLFLLTIASIIVQQRTLIDYTGKMNLLAYAVDDYLDHIGTLVGTPRLDASAAVTTVQIKLSAVRAQNTTIPAGTRITAGDNVFFATKAAVVIPAGETTITSESQCTETGTLGNDYAVGELRTIVDPIPFVESILNITKSEGGSDKETNDAYRLRIQEAPEQFSVAGPDGAYIYHAKKASALIKDVSVTSPNPAEVEVRPLLAGGKIPGTELLEEIAAALNNRLIRPLTDRVLVLAPTEIRYNIEMTYWIDRDDSTTAAAIQTAVATAVDAYVLWQQSKLGRDINPSELMYRVRAAGAKRAEIKSPVYTATTADQLAIAEMVNVKFGGLEDG